MTVLTETELQTKLEELQKENDSLKKQVAYYESNPFYTMRASKKIDGTDTLNVDKNVLQHNLKTLRIMLHYSMVDMGRKITPEANISSISRWERGVTIPRIDAMRSFAKLAHMPIQEFVSKRLPEIETMNTDLERAGK